MIQGAATAASELADGAAKAPQMVILASNARKVADFLGGGLKNMFEVKPPELLQDDNRRCGRCYMIAIWGVACAFKMWQDVPLFGFDWFTVAALLLCVQVVAGFARGRPSSMKVDVALVFVAWIIYRVRTETLSRPGLVSGEIRGAHLVVSFVVFQSMMIVTGTHQGLILGWTILVYNTCWLTNEPVVHETFILITFLAHSVAFILQHEEAQKRLGRQLAEQRRLEKARAEERHQLQQAKAEARQQRIEYSLNLVLQQLKSPLLLLVSDLKNADVSPEMAQLTVKMLAARVGQIWELFTGLSLQVDQEINAMKAREAEGVDEPAGGVAAADGAADEAPVEEAPAEKRRAEEEPAAESESSSRQAAIPTAAAASTPVATLRLPAQQAPSSRSSRSSVTGEARTRPVPSVSSMRVVFDAMHGRGKMKELTLRFEEHAEQPFGLLDWVWEEHSTRVSDWIQEEVNKAVAERVQGQESHTEDSVINGVRLSLPWSDASFEATSLTLRSLTCDIAEEQPSMLTEAVVRGIGSGGLREKDSEGSEAAAEGEEEQREELEEEEEEEQEQEEEEEEEEDNSEEEDEEEDEFDIDSITSVTGVLDLTGILLSGLMPQRGRHRRAVWSRPLRSVGEEDSQ